MVPHGAGLKRAELALHHVITHCETTGNRFRTFLKDRGISDFDLWNLRNALPLPKAIHGPGRYREVHHGRVFAFLEKATEGKTGSAARGALKRHWIV